jgi:hypothetical protein
LGNPRQSAAPRRLDQRRFDGLRLLRQVPAITELAELDSSGREQLRVSRLAMELTGDPGPRCFRATPLPPLPAAQAAVGGLGIGVTMKDGLIKVVTLINEKPATKAEILADDIITALDDEPVQGLTLDQAVQKMRGPVNTRIKLTIVRMGEGKPIEITMTRELIRVPAIVSRDTSADADVSKCLDPSDPADYSHEPKFTEAVAKKVYYGPVYFRRESEPYMTLSLAGTRLDAGVNVAEVNLKFIWDVVTQMKVGERGQAYVVDGQGRLIVHRDISLVLDTTDMEARVQLLRTQLAQVRAARTDGANASGEAKDIHGRDVLVAYTTIPPLGWLVFVEIPVEDADSLAR